MPDPTSLSARQPGPTVGGPRVDTERFAAPSRNTQGVRQLRIPDEEDSLTDGMLIGAGVGAVVWLSFQRGMAGMGGRRDFSSKENISAIVIGAGIGAMVGALVDAEM